MRYSIQLTRPKELAHKGSNRKISHFNSYIGEILRTSKKYLEKTFTEAELTSFLNDLYKIDYAGKSNEEIVDLFTRLYLEHIKRNYQNLENPNYNKVLYKAVKSDTGKVKIYWGDVYGFLKQMPAESVQLMVTSPPYYNAREYSQWTDLNAYLEDMRKIIRESYRVLDNHRVFVFNIGDIFDNDNIGTKAVWGKRRLPLGAYFIKLFEEEGFTFVDDFIWDKGEVQSERHKNGSTPYPLYQYPMNCYEHLLVFHKHRLDLTRFPCPVCGSLKVSGNTQSELGLQSWECKNLDCFERSEGNRGKRFSLKTILTQNKYNRESNIIDHDLIKRWRRDIVKFSPVIKINSKGKNTLGHTAPFPEDIPEMAVNFFSYKGDIVLDPFAGSFTTPIVANRLKRIGVGCELRKDLFAHAIKENIHKNKMDFEEV